MRKTIAKSTLKICGRDLLCAGLTVQALMFAPAMTLGAERPKPINQVNRIHSTSDGEGVFQLVQYAGEEPSSGSGISSAFKKAGSSISNFFSPTAAPASSKFGEQKVAEDDPISLSSMPENVNAEVYMSAGRLMENAGNFEAAERQYKTCLEKYPSHRLAQICYGRLLHRTKRLEEAVSVYEQAAKDHPKDATIKNDLGLCLARMGRKEEAMDQFHKATMIAPEDPRYRNNLAMVLVEAGRNDEALSQLVYAHGDAKGYYNLGFLFYRQGNKSEAAKAFQAALANDATLKPAEDMLRRLQGNGLSEAAPAPPTAGNARFISDEPASNPITAPVQPRMQGGKIPPAPELEPPRLLPPVR